MPTERVECRACGKKYIPQVGHGCGESPECVILRDKLADQVELTNKLKTSLNQMIGWTINGACADCDMFREGPSSIEWMHEVDCAHLKVINEACDLLGIDRLESHSIANPKEEMHKLAQERADRYNKDQDESKMY